MSMSLCQNSAQVYFHFAALNQNVKMGDFTQNLAGIGKNLYLCSSFLDKTCR